MNNSEKYKILADGETGVMSGMGIIPSDTSFIFTKTTIEQSLRNNKDFQLLSFEEKEEEYFLARINYKQEEYDVNFYVSEVANLEIEQYAFANRISEADYNSALAQPYFLDVSMFFGTEALTSFHLQLKIMYAIVPDASLIIDFMSFRLLSAQWLRMTAESQIPPSPDYLYTIHGVYDEKGDKKTYWLHTHGLLRCGSVEFEILNFSNNPQQMNDLIVHVVKKALKEPIKENQKFQIGYDGMGINLSWIRWEEALNDFPEDILGGMSDRQGEGNIHADPSGVIFAVEDNNMISPEIYGKTLSENPIFYISEEETYRMSELAKERFFTFKDAFERYGVKPQKKSFFKNLFGKKEEEEPWQFLVKLGLAVDDADSATDREHLWFEVLSVNNDTVEGKLLNQPYWISGLNQGDVKTYPIELLTDWLIYPPEGGSYTTDSIYELGYYK